MNKERLEQLAVWLENGALHETITFDMRKGVAVIGAKGFDGTDPNTCRTAVCIAGMAWQMFQEDKSALRTKIFDRKYEEDRFGRAAEPCEIDFDQVRAAAAEALELTTKQAYELFEPHRHGNTSGEDLATFNDPAWAARVIRRLIATGDVDWKNTRYAP